MQTRGATSLLLVAAGLLLKETAPGISPLLVALAFLVMLPEVYALFLVLLCGGWPLTDLHCFRNHCVDVDENGNCTYIGIEVIDCRHGCYDLSDKEFFNLSTTLFHGGFAAPSVDYIIVVYQRRFFVIIRSCAHSSEEVRTNLCSALRSLEETLSVVGCSWRRLEGVQLYRLLRPETLRQTRRSVLFKAGVLAAASLPLAARLYSFAPIFLAAVLAAARGHSARGYAARPPLRVSTIESVNSFYSFPSSRDILSRSRTLYSLLPNDAYVAIRVEPASVEEEQAIDTEAYRSYEVGTALDKLSLIHRSSKFFAAARRRWERREALYRLSGVVISDERSKRLLVRVGLRLSNKLNGLEVLH